MARDRSGRAAAVIAVAGVGLSLLDAGFSLALAGRFSEMNPVLSPFLQSPGAFLALKTGLVLAGVWTLLRVRSRAGDAALAGCLLAYLAVSGYWLAHARSHAAPEARGNTLGVARD